MTAAEIRQQLLSDEFRKVIESEVLKVIKNLAEAGNTPKERVQEIAQYVLDTIQPNKPIDELYRNAAKLDDKFPELGPVVIAVMREYEETYEEKGIIDVSNLIRAGKFADAESMVKKILMFQVIQ
jgi:hypothetical protein